MGRPKKRAEEDEIDVGDVLVDAKFHQGNENILRNNATIRWTPEMVEEYKLCAKSILHFAEKHFYIVTLDDGKQRIELYKYQKRLLKAFKANRFNVILSSRQSGKTTSITIYALWLMCFQDYKKVTILANKESTAKEIYERIKMAYEELPVWLKPAIKSWRKDGFELRNKSKVSISATSKSGPRGGSSNLLIIDEAAFCPPEVMKELWKSAVPVITASQKSQIVLISTPNRKGNKFYQTYKGSLEPGSIWHSERVDWWDVPGRDEAWKKMTMELLAEEENVSDVEEAFRQEFGNEFLEDGKGSAVLDAAILEELKKNCPSPILVNDEGAYKIYKLPEPGRHYVAGVDVGEGIGRTNSVIQLFDVTSLNQIEQVACFAANNLSPYEFGTKCFQVLNDWGRPPLLVESNNNGLQVLDVLDHTYNYENIVCYKLTGNSVHYNTHNRKGVHSHTNVRNNSITNFRYYCNTLKCVKFNDAETIYEMNNFVKGVNDTFDATSREFLDDRVLASVWALFILSPAVVTKYFEVIGVDNNGRPSQIEPLFYNLEALRKSPLLIGGDILRNKIPAKTNGSRMYLPGPGGAITQHAEEAKSLWMWLHQDDHASGYEPAARPDEATLKDLGSRYTPNIGIFFGR